MTDVKDKELKQIDVGEAASRNPKVDTEQLRRAESALGDLTKSGVLPARYQIGSPYRRGSRTVPRGGRHFA